MRAGRLARLVGAAFAACMLAAIGMLRAGVEAESRPSSAAVAVPAAPRPCPRVFVYNRSSLDERHLTLNGYGAQLSSESPAWLRNTQQHGVGAIILSRLMRSRCVVDDAAEAELFIIPMVQSVHVAPRGGRKQDDPLRVYTKMAPSAEEYLWPHCERLLVEDWHSTLPHLTEHTVVRHVFVCDKFFDLWGFCSNIGRFKALLRSRPGNLALLRAMPWPRNTIGRGGRGGNHFTFAYPSAVHLRRSDAPPPWSANRSQRSVLVMFGGSTYGHALSRKLRSALVEQCRAHGPTVCELVHAESMAGEGAIVHALAAKRRARFCLEPPGFGDERKAIADALSLGCIPVLFMPATDAYLWQHNWPDAWKARSMVQLDAQQVISGAQDAVRALERIPEQQVASMQQSIAQSVHTLHYAFDDVPGDAFYVFLRVLAANTRSTTIQYNDI